MTLHTRMSMDDDEATITLVGYAGPESAPKLDRLIRGVGTLPIRRLVFDLAGLTALPSASVRSLLMTHQVLGRALEIEFRGARDAVAETIRLSGFPSAPTALPPVARIARTGRIGGQSPGAASAVALAEWRERWADDRTRPRLAAG
ncbi:MAG: STAS domain-containing protein [Umezawaea sp.]